MRHSANGLRTPWNTNAPLRVTNAGHMCVFVMISVQARQARLAPLAPRGRQVH